MSEQALIIVLAIAIALFIVAYIIRAADKSRNPRKEGKGKRCPKCGAIVNIKRSACRHCGYKFE